MRQRNSALSLLLAGAAVLSGQNSPVIRVDVKLVQVDAVVTDSKGKHIGNLSASDFEVLQDGKPVAITNFSWIAPLPRQLRAAAGSGTPASPSIASLKIEDVRRTIALVVDDLGLSAESVVHVRDALRRFVNREMQPGDVAAIVRTSAGSGALQQFTTNPAILNAAIARIKFTTGRVGVSSFAPAIAPSESPSAASNALDGFNSDVFLAGTFGALRYVIDGLRDMPGRKSLVLFSENLPMLDAAQDSKYGSVSIAHGGLNANYSGMIRLLTDAANRSSVVINTIDPRGLQTYTDLRDTDPNPQVAAQRETALSASREGLATLARDTGGLFIRDNNLIDEALGEVVEDSEGYYLIGYHPDAATFDPKTGAALYHQVQVRLRGTGLKVRSRSGFFGESDTVRNAPLSGASALAHAIASPFASGDIHVQLTTLFNQTVDRRSNLSVLLQIDAQDLDYAIQPDGLRQAHFEVVAMTFGVNGNHVDRADRTFDIELKPAQYEAALGKGLVYLVNQPVKTPGTYQMRVALRDRRSDRIGVASQFIEVPDLAKGRLALSSILLRDRDQMEEGAATNAALRAYKRGDELAYQYLVFNAKPGPDRKAQLTVQTRLFREGKLVRTGEPMVPSLAQESKPGRALAGGHLNLSREISPGDYVLQLIVTDTLAKEKYRIASQAMDFEVLP